MTCATWLGSILLLSLMLVSRRAYWRKPLSLALAWKNLDEFDPHLKL